MYITNFDCYSLPNAFLYAKEAKIYRKGNSIIGWCPTLIFWSIIIYIQLPLKIMNHAYIVSYCHTSYQSCIRRLWHT